MSTARCLAPSVTPSAFAGFRYSPEVITLAVRWYLRFGLSYRDVEELLAERGIEVDHVSIFRGCSASRRCWRRRHARANSVSETAGGLMRLTSSVRSVALCLPGD